ncbi:MAG TPA: phage portal protein [Caulobacteraceae bacterium]|nr:phage portal protein [Caulobacteraceae bacterium]
MADGNAPAVLGPSGRPIPAKSIARIRNAAALPRARGGFRASLSGSAPEFFPYDAANWTGQDLGDWLPWIRSPDNEINLYRDRITARARDLYRNDGWAKGAIGRILDSTIGASYRMVAKPDYRALALWDKAFDEVWADEFRGVAEALWRSYAEDLGRYNDVARQLTFSQQCRLALGHKLVDGESTMLAYWLPDRVGAGQARWATAFLGVDPDLLSNPYQLVDTRYLRGGVEIDDFGVPVAYHFRKAHQNDWFNAVESMEWERIPREDADGFRRVYHDFDRDRFAQNRGVSIFAPVLGRLKMLARYYGVELSAATVASAFGVYVTSPYDTDMVRQALEGDDEDVAAGLSWYQDLRQDFHASQNLTINETKLATLAPGEKIETVQVARPNSAFSPFTHEMLRGFAAVLGMSSEQVHNDYSEASWSSARAGIVEAEKTFVRRTGEFAVNTASPMYAGWLQEVWDAGELPMPLNAHRAPDWREGRTAYARCRWLGAARGWVDPVAERQGVVLGLDACLSTLEQEAAKQGGDWEENLNQRALERRRMKELDLPEPEWMGATVTATEDSKKPKPV